MKSAVGISFLILLFYLIRTMRLGKKARRIKFNLEFTDFNELEISDREAEHERSAKITCWVALVAIVITEIMVRFGGGLINKPLFALHMCFAGPFVIILWLLRFKITGKGNRNLHRKLGYMCLGTFIVALVTGSILLYQFK